MKNQKYYSVLLMFIIFLALSTSVDAASNSLQFIVTDSSTNQLINGASVSVKNNATQLTVKYGLTVNGYITFYNLSASNYTAYANASEYGTSAIAFSISENVSSYAFNVSLAANQAPSCVRANPSVSINPSSQSAYAGVNATYNVSITNNDNSACGPSVFYSYGFNNVIGAYSTDSYAGSAYASISPGTSLSYRFYIYTVSATPPGSYYVGIAVNNTNTTSYSGSGTASLNILASSAVCTDSDGGLNYEKSGVVTVLSGAYSDFCSNGDNFTLNEYYCNETQVAQLAYFCPNGCKNAACIKQGTSDWDVSVRFDKARQGLFYPFSASAGMLGTEYRAMLNAEDNIYADMPYAESCPSYWNADQSARRAKGWYVERKKISDDKYKILIRGTAPADCNYREYGYVKGELNINSANGWIISNIIKCNAQKSNKRQETYCNAGSTYVKFAGGNDCGGCCACADSGSVDIELIVERNNSETNATSPSLITTISVKPEINNPVTIPIAITNNTVYVCNGCSKDGTCYPLGYRMSGGYCAPEKNFITQMPSDASCENSFECGSNVCASGKCISGDLLQMIIGWFRRLFEISSS